MASKKKKTVNVKMAGKQAIKYLCDIEDAVYDVQLEEVEKSDDGNFWLITLSYNTGILSNKKYKIFKIDISSGEVLSMKIRKFNEE